MKKKKVLLISSTGGHLNELMQLSPLFEKYDYKIITEKDKANEPLKEKYGDKLWHKSKTLYIYIQIFLSMFKNNIFIFQNKTKSNSYNRNTHSRANVHFRKNIWKQNNIYRNFCK